MGIPSCLLWAEGSPSFLGSSSRLWRSDDNILLTKALGQEENESFLWRLWALSARRTDQVPVPARLWLQEAPRGLVVRSKTLIAKGTQMVFPVPATTWIRDPGQVIAPQNEESIASLSHRQLKWD